MIYFLFSADYELFFGENLASEYEVVIEPTEMMLKTCGELGMPATIFADLLCFFRYRELGMEEFPAQAEQQMRDAVRDGHDVQTHLHPHWLCAVQEPGTWRADEQAYLLGTYPGQDCYQFTCELLQKSTEYLSSLLRPVDPDYSCVAFRAGGYGLQPNESQIISALLDCGYLIDSSIVPGITIDTKYHRVDFTKVPQRGNWWLAPESGINACGTEGLFAIPIAAYTETRAQVLRRMARKMLRRRRPATAPVPASNPFSRGKPVAVSNPKEQQAPKPAGPIKRRWQKMAKMATPITFELELSVRHKEMKMLTEQYVKKHQRRGQDLFFSMSCHPKALHQAEMDALGIYWDYVSDKWGDQIRPITFLEASRLLTSRLG